MTVTGITTNKLEGQLGISPSAGSKMLAIIGPSTKGDAYMGTLVALTRSSDVVSIFGYGPLSQAACYAIEHYGQPVLLGKTDATTDGSADTVVRSSGAGTSVVTVNVSVYQPTDDFEVSVWVTLGGTIGTGPISLRVSLDGGRNYRSAVSLGTANTYTILYPDGESTGIVLNFAAGTLVTDEVITFQTTAPAAIAADLSTTLTALKNTTQRFEAVLLASAATTTVTAALDAFVTSCYSVGRYVWWASNTPLMDSSVRETDAEYQTAQSAAFSAFASNTGMLSCGSMRLVSSVPQAVYNHVRPVSWGLVPLALSRPIHISIGQPVPNHVIPGAALTDTNGNVADRCHDESLYPGLDDAGFATVRTWPRTGGVWCNIPRIHSAAGSDFDILPKIRIWNTMAESLYDYFRPFIQSPILVTPATGFILETEASRIEKGAAAAATSALGDAAGVAGVQVTLSRTDNLLSAGVPTLTVTAVLQPPGYPQRITLNLGFTVAVTAAV